MSVGRRAALAGRQFLTHGSATAVVLMTTAVVALAVAASDYKVVEGWGELPAGMTWGEVPGVSLDRSGTIGRSATSWRGALKTKH